MTQIILFLAANPKDTTPLRLDQEVREVENGLQRIHAQKQYILRQKWAVRVIDLRRAMLDYKPQIVHFSGHGQGNLGIKLENETGETQLVSTEALAEFFGLFPQVKCVVLNACYSEIQAEAISQCVDYVIGMSQEVSDKAAIEFAVAFYDALSAGEDISFAFRLACNAIRMLGIPEHLTPTLKIKDPALEAPGNLSGAKSPLLYNKFADEFTKSLPNNPLGTLNELYNRFREKHLRQALTYTDYILAYHCLKQFLAAHDIEYEFPVLKGFQQQDAGKINELYVNIHRFISSSPQIDVLMNRELAKTWIAYIQNQ